MVWASIPGAATAAPGFLNPPAGGHHAHGPVLAALLLRLDDPPHGTRQSVACDGMNVGQVGAGRPAGRRTVAAHITLTVPAAGAHSAGRIDSRHLMLMGLVAGMVWLLAGQRPGLHWGAVLR